MPTYLGGFLLGTAAVLLIMRMKTAMMPEFHEFVDPGPPLKIAAGGRIRLQLGAEPGRYIAYGFPTQLMLGRKEPDGRVVPVRRLEYRELVEPEVVIEPEGFGAFELRAQFFVCAYPGEAHCAKVLLTRDISAYSGRPAPSEAVIRLDLPAYAAKGASAGATVAKPQ